MHIFADGINAVSLSNNNLRINLVQLGPDNHTVDAGTLIIPINRAGNFVATLAKTLEQLDEQVKAKGKAGEEPPRDSNIQ